MRLRPTLGQVFAATILGFAVLLFAEVENNPDPDELAFAHAVRMAYDARRER